MWKEGVPPTNLLVRCGRFSGRISGFHPLRPNNCWTSYDGEFREDFLVTYSMVSYVHEKNSVVELFFPAETSVDLPWEEVTILQS